MPTVAIRARANIARPPRLAETRGNRRRSGGSTRRAGWPHGPRGTASGTGAGPDRGPGSRAARRPSAGRPRNRHRAGRSKRPGMPTARRAGRCKPRTASRPASDPWWWTASLPRAGRPRPGRTLVGSTGAGWSNTPGTGCGRRRTGRPTRRPTARTATTGLQRSRQLLGAEAMAFRIANGWDRGGLSLIVMMMCHRADNLKFTRHQIRMNGQDFAPGLTFIIMMAPHRAVYY